MIFKGMLCAISISALVSCAPVNPLTKRIQKPDDREFYVENFGSRMPLEMRRAYVEGRIIPGMRIGDIYELVGAPDEQVVTYPHVFYSNDTLVVNAPGEYRDIIWIWYRSSDLRDTLGTVVIRDSKAIFVTGALAVGDGKGDY